MGQTTLEIRTKKLHEVPIVDFMPFDYGTEGQMIGFEVGPVCFN